MFIVRVSSVTEAENVQREIVALSGASRLQTDRQTEELYCVLGRGFLKTRGGHRPRRGREPKVPDRFTGSLDRPELIRKIRTCDAF